MAPLVLACPDPTPPVLECHISKIYGAPLGRINRVLPGSTTLIPVSGISLHCVQDTFDGYLAKACSGVTKKPLTDCHTSFHYIIDAELGTISSLVSENDVAWAWQNYRTNFPVTYPTAGCVCPEPCSTPPCPPSPPEQIEYTGWPELSALYPNISADFYTITIGVLLPSRIETTILDGELCCNGPYGMSEIAYNNLIRLIAWIVSRYNFPLTKERIAFQDEIVTTDLDCLECPCRAQGTCLVCNVSSYCERCLSPSDPTLKIDTELVYVYGENAAGCRVKVLLSDFIALLGA